MPMMRMPTVVDVNVAWRNEVERCKNRRPLTEQEVTELMDRVRKLLAEPEPFGTRSYTNEEYVEMMRYHRAHTLAVGAAAFAQGG